MRFLFFFLVIGIALLNAATVEQMKSEKRFAFVIANGRGSDPANDPAVASAKALASFFETKGFETVTAYNMDRAELIKTFRTFEKELKPDAVVALAYSGRMIAHGSQAWILPARMQLESLEQLRLSAVSYDFLLRKLQRQVPRVILGFVDAYRFADKPNTTDGGLILKATGRVEASDVFVRWNGDAARSPFFGRLIKHAGGTSDDMEGLAEALAGDGVHARISEAAFYFNVPARVLTPADKAWHRAELQNSVVGYEAFAIAFPDSAFKPAALKRIEALKAKQEAAKSAPAALEKEQKLKEMEAQLRAQQEALARLKAEKKSLESPEETAKSEASALRFYEPDEMVTVPAGVFLMGSERFENSTPVHMVTVTKAFKMSAYEVSNKEYAAFLKATGTAYRKKKLLENESAAAAYVSWEEAVRYAEWLSFMSGKQYRLPTEAQWEYAARAGSDTLYTWGTAIANAPQYAWMASNAHGFVHSRGLLQPNAFGLFDMAGNVAEWCADSATPNYEGAPSDAEKSAAQEGAPKIIRGGSIQSEGEALSPFFRDSNAADYRSGSVGFRLVELL